jgi:hypothetical protein
MNPDAFDGLALIFVIAAATAAYLAVRGISAPERTDRRKGAPSWAWISVMSFGTAMLLLLT